MHLSATWASSIPSSPETKQHVQQFLYYLNHIARLLHRFGWKAAELHCLPRGRRAAWQPWGNVIAPLGSLSNHTSAVLCDGDRSRSNTDMEDLRLLKCHPSLMILSTIKMGIKWSPLNHYDCLHSTNTQLDVKAELMVFANSVNVEFYVLTDSFLHYFYIWILFSSLTFPKGSIAGAISRSGCSSF